MNLIDLDENLTFVYFDEDSKQWKHKTSSLQEFLSIYTAWQYLKVYHIDFTSLACVVADEVIRGQTNDNKIKRS